MRAQYESGSTEAYILLVGSISRHYNFLLVRRGGSGSKLRPGPSETGDEGREAGRLRVTGSVTARFYSQDNGDL